MRPKLAGITIPTICSDCGEPDLLWSAQSQNRGPAVDGRICMREVEPIFVLGCECCSKTILVVPAAMIADWFNQGI